MNSVMLELAGTNGWNGFCDIVVPEETLLGEDDEPLVGEDDEPLVSEPVWDVHGSAEWMCEYDVKPYSC